MRDALLLAVMTVALGGCATLPASFRSALPAALRTDPSAAATEDVAERIAAVRKEIARTTDPALKAKLEHDLFSLHIDPRNEKPDYAAALEALDDHASLAPERAEDPEVRQWLGVLRELERARADATAARNDARAARDDARAAQDTLQRKLEELQALDLEVERQRRSLR